ncbi:sigma-54-dependent Fis family transcriptional regulator [Pullulanibacillus camelliae]|uniref:Sigma-54-dependent Fis family transcriptional regulator n=1 Tax=Pullulanibacillus camelliae TaxID=1707096 RepID=A0A8J2YMD8_9BACL|nr:sigma-54-dependent Fis family transcriptional regulator [Pullulanibacillus camelliae]GGE52995.1 sigma-54-dependent Fis family transcriptional regulator [Pullulanibacillus camelliae]
MKIKVLLIAPYSGLKELALRLTKEQDELEITVREGDLEEAVAVANEIGSEQFDIVISRGGTAKLLRENLGQPVIEIPLSGYDILRTLTLIKDYKGKVEMVAFPNICQGVNAVSNLLDIHIPYSVIEHSGDVERLILEAKAKGAKLIVGDTVTIKVAKRHGLQGILFTSGRESILEAFQQARQLYLVLHKYENRGNMLEKIMDQSGEGVAVISLNGELHYCNTPFLKMWHIADDVTTVPLSSGTLSGLKALKHIMAFQTIAFRKVVQGRELHCQIRYFDDEKYLLKTDDTFNKESKDLTVEYLRSSIHSFTQIPGTSVAIRKVINQARKLKNEGLMAIYGEKGVEKKPIAFAMRGESVFHNCPFLVVTITHPSDNAYNALKKLLEKSKGVILYIRGTHRLDPVQQRGLTMLNQHQENRQVIYAFYADPKSTLEPEFLKIFSTRLLHIPPLRERTEDLGEHIRLFIGQFNEKYGKQVAGIHSDALELLSTSIWKGNVQECESIVERLIQHVNGEYIHLTDVEQVLADSTINYKSAVISGERTIPIDINKPLEDIENQIIMRILELENMNQTKTAERLGITRATLWRKLKKYEQSQRG